jgi:Flp pilus assembly pilin Flp
MTRLTQIAQSLWRQDEGQDLLEYALLITLIAIVAIGGVTLAGTNVAAVFTNIAAAI